MKPKFTLTCNLDKILKEKDITPYKLSKETGERIGTIYKLVNNQDLDSSRLSTSMMANICGYLGIGLGELFEITEETGG
ncbi:helix-turn-helix domain-containing protein [Paenibacillus polymyxa]|uniref:helix-turn-helix domain-containing protein n=1 Tax=Paenibacillus polymyxa TaxID=1406 RepID=UPI002025B245|nr:helix-turn-helix transcriptional regulator [Paenibacillus polymyxa]MDU8675337.1 helix-turn-helix transcriptional regulator [Paenibacillus polymyxa]MDU8700244.1 helix-turn-helix transcriptional regulator [Paenibacillus polymyxa]URJ54861.1 helix-turn-helix transcriptional regulator [Paenibacillus polymyxa]URJ66704.1 helix-turn-helix transcriptional regulator [Paenibacillus polymyxa]URJ69374.1 helix-turn-helix transcriptional regulator [Paenibacillus polymyxa]